MTTLRKRHFVGLVALAVTGAGLSLPALRVLQHAYGADDVVEGFFPALCEGDMPPAELLALADWPLDAEGIGCRPHPGVFDAVASTAGPGGRAGSISPALAEYVLSLDRAPKADPSKQRWGAGSVAANASAGAQDAFASTTHRDGLAVAAAFAVSDTRPEEINAVAALGLRDDLPQPPTTESTDALPPAVPALPATRTEPGTELPLFAGQLVADDTLGELRGGFETPGGLRLSFGIERVVYINGELMSTTTLTIADLGAVVGGAAAVQSLPVGTNIAVIQNGPNNTFDVSALASGSFATVIQNSLDNQNIQTITTIDAQVNSAQMLQANRFADSLRNAVNASLLR